MEKKEILELVDLLALMVDSVRLVQSHGVLMNRTSETEEAVRKIPEQVLNAAWEYQEDFHDAEELIREIADEKLREDLLSDLQAFEDWRYTMTMFEIWARDALTVPLADQTQHYTVLLDPSSVCEALRLVDERDAVYACSGMVAGVTHQGFRAVLIKKEGGSYVLNLYGFKESRVFIRDIRERIPEAKAMEYVSGGFPENLLEHKVFQEDWDTGKEVRPGVVKLLQYLKQE